MSFILDALKKAEQDKAAARPPPELAAAVTAPPPPSSYRQTQEQAQRRTLTLICGMLLGVLLLGALGWMLLGRGKPGTMVEASAPLAAAASTESASPAAAAPSRPAAQPAPAEAEASEEAASVAASDTAPVRPEDAGAEASSMDELIGDEEALDEPAPTAAAAAAAATEREPTDAEIAALSKPVQPATSKPARKPGRASEPATGVKRLRDMPPSFRTGFPQLNVDVHYYDDNPLRRFVIVNGKKYRETDTLLEGPKVVEITEDGVILDQGGTRVVKSIPR